MENPWKNFVKELESGSSKEGELVLKGDKDILKKVIDELEEKISRKGKEVSAAMIGQKIQTSLYPEPFIGNPRKAKILLLGSNPGFEGGEKLYHDNYTAKGESFIKLVLKNLDWENQEVSFYYLDPNLKDLINPKEIHPGYTWWQSALKDILKKLAGSEGDKFHKISNSVAYLEFFPYHSARFPGRFKTPKNYLPSQEYTFNLLTNIINGAKSREDIKIVVLRIDQGMWIRKFKNEFEELKNAGKCYFLKPSGKGPSSISLNEARLGKTEFNEIVRIINDSPMP